MDQAPPHRPPVPASARPRPVEVALVVLGGAAGTALRVLLGAAVPDRDGFPVGIFLINMTGAFALGLVLELLGPAGADVGPRRVVRLAIGTGLIGGYTTYSALAVGIAVLLQDGRLLLGLGYGIGTVLLGAFLTATGMTLARVRTRKP